MKKTDGFTLVELMVGIVCSALVSGAIITFMLMGVRTNRSVLDANSEQRNAKIVITMMENLASEGSISAVEYIGDSAEVDGKQDWTILDNSSSPILSYSASSQSLRGRNGSVLMEGVFGSSVTLSDQGNLLTFNIKTEESDYTTSVYCRLSEINQTDLSDNVIQTEVENNLGTSPSVNATGRSALLEKVFGQLGSNGYILDSSHNSTGTSYTQWYCDNKGDLAGNWGIDTPWCAIFISWALAENSHLENRPMEANVDTLWSKVPCINTNNSPGSILPGDLIFFDWDLDTKSDTNTDLEHVGVVLYTDGVWVYTIEGNSSNQVAIRRYSWFDPSIYGYGRLRWNDELPL